MSFTMQAKIEGLSGLLKALAGVDAKLRRKATRKAVGEAGKIILRAAKGKVRKKSGLLKKSLGRKVKVYRGTGTAVAIVGPRTGFRETVQRGNRQMLSDPVKYAHLVELGTVRSQAFPFLSSALEENRSAIVNVMTEVFRAALG